MTHHIYDHEIVQLYPEIIRYERSLNVNIEDGLSGYLNRISNKVNINSAEPIDDIVNRLKRLIQERKIGTGFAHLLPSSSWHDSFNKSETKTGILVKLDNKPIPMNFFILSSDLGHIPRAVCP